LFPNYVKSPTGVISTVKPVDRHFGCFSRTLQQRLDLSPISGRMAGHYSQYDPAPARQFYPGELPMLCPPTPLQPRFRANSMDDIGLYSGYNEVNREAVPSGQSQPRHRRRQPQGDNPVKHRRTRSGCYSKHPCPLSYNRAIELLNLPLLSACRTRRVKCDEGRPICARCLKGKRDCQYPGTTSSLTPSKASKGNSRAKDSGGESSSSPSGAEDEGDDINAPLGVVPDCADECELQSSTSDSQVQADGAVSGSRRSAARRSVQRSAAKHASKPSISQSFRWPSVPNNVKGYLRYHKERLSHHHYGLKYDGGSFLKTTFLEIAMNDEALLYAVVAFAAYHHAVTEQQDRIQTFLDFHNQSIMSLQHSLSKSRHSVATLLTILQLATIEEFLGDWVNLLAHQRAALQILTELFTTETIMQDETRRKIIVWYLRFDLFAAAMSGGEPSLGRGWFVAATDFFTAQVADRPMDMSAQFEEYFAISRLLATDGALLLAAKRKNTITDEYFESETQKLLEEMAAFGKRISTTHSAPEAFVKQFPDAAPPSPDDITNFHDPYFLYGGSLFTMNYVLIDFWAIDLMFKYQIMSARNQQPTAELTCIALQLVKMFQAIEWCSDPGKPRGAMLGCQASLGIASLFLPRDERHTMWCRRKYALIEQNGYIYPSTLRERMSDLWQTDVTHWWLPNGEGLPDVVKSIRDFIEYRATAPRDASGQQVREMSGIFNRIAISEHDSGADTDSFDYPIDPALAVESSPEQPWT
ncbi:Fungal specific transcription factor domain, partial [Teratosphaeria destructans]